MLIGNNADKGATKMKVCEDCGEEIFTPDGDGKCQRCDNKDKVSRKARQSRKMRDEAMRSLGLVKVRGALGGTYWE